jgi:hypothetical protein
VTVGRFGRALLGSLPPRSLLLSHTDLNYNAVRYLQACEGLRPDVVHLSLQLLPCVRASPSPTLLLFASVRRASALLCRRSVSCCEAAAKRARLALRASVAARDDRARLVAQNKLR